jgi:hypothetical protein
MALSLATLLFLLVLIAPFGNYPLNDDWQYARVVKILLEQHRFLVDTPVAPSLVGQAYLVIPWISLLGFSHTLLRILTLLLALLGLWSIDRLLELAEVPVGLRRVAQLVLLFNPLFLYLGLSFMTEIYGYAPTLLAAALWFGERRRSLTREGAPPMRWWVSLLVAVAIGGSFWTRQFSVAIYPALLASLVFALMRRRQWRQLLRATPALLLGMAAFFAIVGAYVPWAKASGNYQGAFDRPMQRMSTFDRKVWLWDVGGFLFYLTAFLAPLLALISWKKLRIWKVVPVALGLAWLSWKTMKVYHFKLGVTDFSQVHFHHKVFPFLSNIIYNAGIGPVTLLDVYGSRLSPASWPREVWVGIERTLAALFLLWVPLVGRASLRRSERPSVADEILAFALWWTAAATALTVQAYQKHVFDRYLMPMLFAVIVVVAIVAARNQAGPRARWAAALLWLPVAWFTVAGLHDQFRWNDARWRMVRDLMSQGVSPTVVQGGYEVTGWLVADNYKAQKPAVGCIGACRCTWRDWYCQDDSYQIAMHELPGYQVVRQQPIGYWLAPGPPVLLLRRNN